MHEWLTFAPFKYRVYRVNGSSPKSLKVKAPYVPKMAQGWVLALFRTEFAEICTNWCLFLRKYTGVVYVIPNTIIFWLSCISILLQAQYYISDNKTRHVPEIKRRQCNTYMGCLHQATVIWTLRGPSESVVGGKASYEIIKT